MCKHLPPGLLSWVFSFCCKPRPRVVGLNQLLRGGGRQAKENKKKEVLLLDALGKLLKDFSPNASGAVNRAGASSSQNTAQSTTSTSDELLLGALGRLLERAKKNPVGLIDRL